uniref:Ig-like domain-containing protein n=1 Tax=Astyanax mexicanus TaxID=7994 RepID=A0A3B1KEZ1_ASTMX
DSSPAPSGRQTARPRRRRGPGGSVHALPSLISTSFGLEVNIPQSTYKVARGDQVAITCTFQPKNPVNNLIIISWTADPDGSFDDEGVSVKKKHLDEFS